MHIMHIINIFLIYLNLLLKSSRTGLNIRGYNHFQIFNDYNYLKPQKMLKE